MANRFGPYRLLRRIASGGMGEVYMAVLEKEGGFSKTVALKTLLPGVECREAFLEMFEGEARLAAMLNHANIVQVFDHGCVEGKSYLTMELVEGPDLASILSARPGTPFPPGVAVEIGVQACRGLAHAHERRDLKGRPVGMVHRDVSPSNVLLTVDGQVKLADFGLAKFRAVVTPEGLVTGKYSYMSPEQAAGRPVSPKSDLFSLGLVLYELFTGARAYPLQEPASRTIDAIAHGQHEPARSRKADLPSAIHDFLDRALRKAPEERFESAARMARALAAACPPCGPEKLAEFVRRHADASPAGLGLAPDPTEVAQKPVSPPATPRTAMKATLVALFVVCWGAGLAWWAFHAPPPPSPAPPSADAPRAPRGLAVEIDAPPPVAEPRPRTPPRVVHKVPFRNDPPPPEQPPALVLSIPAGHRAFVDRREVAGSTVRIRERRPHLVRVIPRGGKRPEVLIRLLPPRLATDTWSASVSSTPWMKIQLGKRPAGQTPRSHLRLPWGRYPLVLSRAGRSLRFDLELAEPP